MVTAMDNGRPLKTLVMTMEDGRALKTLVTSHTDPPFCLFFYWRTLRSKEKLFSQGRNAPRIGAGISEFRTHLNLSEQ